MGDKIQESYELTADFKEVMIVNKYCILSCTYT